MTCNRYNLIVRPTEIDQSEIVSVQSPDGEWVRWEDVKEIIDEYNSMLYNEVHGLDQQQLDTNEYYNL